MTDSERHDGGVYHVGDAERELASMPPESAAVVALDDAWARPKRGNAFGVEYPTHSFDQTKLILSECRRVLEPGGWLIADADDWLLPRLINYLRENWGDASENYQEGYRKTGRVTLTAADGSPDRSTPGMYLSTGGYPVVFAHKGETNRRTSASASQIANRPQERFGWGSVKPIDPYEAWIEGLTEPDETVVVPCAGTAPAAIAAERLGREWVAVDCEPEAREAYRRRRESELASGEQKVLVTDGGRDTDGADVEEYHGPDRWKCPGCGKITVDPGAPIAGCACGCERVQLREWPNGPEDWEAPEWPVWSDYSADPYENENYIVYVGGPEGRHIEEADR